ncbi:hypothetical protein EFP05_02470 [Lactiplantibacillus pentosus]|uniref:hypothetical protein n=1 Tax=Lactiplantibacillus pentosus TaxID=1589 RepID=UPI000C7C0BDD|nr:hypothetical protein [Lactiplantibacillus pentosus]MCE6030327.1 hypothetical protein [Lactiplantibacillus pentosus]MCT3276060.1 hypothetical protein [Lactiplantibacillus pentosus]
MAKKHHALKKVSIIFIVTLLCSTFLNSYVHIHADNESINETIERLVNGDTPHQKIAITNDQEEQISSLIKKEAEVQTTNDTTTLTLTDDQLTSILKQTLSADDFSSVQAATHHKGVSKIVWHGAAKKGNVNIYLSKSMLNFLRGAAIGVGVTTIIALSGGFAGAGTIATIVIRKVISTSIKSSTKGFKYGRKYSIRSWKYKGWSYQ